jgi:hypothetical protein
VIKGFLCTHLTSLNVCHFGMAEATRLNNVALRSSSMTSHAYKFHENPGIGSEVISGGHTNRLVI